MKPSRPKLQPLDYVVMFGGPILFLLIAWYGLNALQGPKPRPNPVQLLREGDVAIGSTVGDVREKLGPPNEMVEQEDGGFVYYYRRSVFESQAKSVSLDEAIVEFTPTGRVLSIRFDRSAPPERPVD